MFKITLGDVWRGLIVAVLTPVAIAVFGVLGAIILAPHFDVFVVDWGALFRSLTNTIIVSAYGAFTGYIIKNFLTDDSQNFLGIKTKS